MIFGSFVSLVKLIGGRHFLWSYLMTMEGSLSYFNLINFVLDIEFID